MSVINSSEVSNAFKGKSNCFFSVQVHFSPRSTNNKKNELDILFAKININFGVVMFSEAWGSEINDPFILTGYDNFFVNRSRRRGGSGSLLSKSNLQCSLVDDYIIVTDDYEVVTVEETDNFFFLLCTALRAQIDMFFLSIF